MSIRIMSHVWDHGPNDKAEVLILLALADFCDDQGRCWPAVATIAHKARMTERGARKIIARLVDTGWVAIDERKGRNGSNLYTINTLNHVHPEQRSPLNHVPSHPEPCSEYPEHGSPKPSRTINEPSLEIYPRDYDVVSDFNKVADVAGWPKVQAYGRPRERAFLARLKDCGGYENWKSTMDRAANSDFLSGRATGTTPASFDWLHKKSNFTKLMEGNYDNRTNDSGPSGPNGSARRGGPGSGTADAFAAVAARMSQGESGGF